VLLWTAVNGGNDEETGATVAVTVMPSAEYEFTFLVRAQPG